MRGLKMKSLGKSNLHQFFTGKTSILRTHLLFENTMLFLIGIPQPLPLRFSIVMSTRRSLENLPAPRDVLDAISRYRDALQSAAKENLHSLVLYGGLARGRFRPGRSDINIIIVIKDDSLSCLAAIAPILRDAWRDIRLEPFIMTLADVPRAAHAFAPKMLDIKRSHVVLFGDDPFADLTIDPRDVARRVEQELRNLSMRLRRRFVAAEDDALRLRDALDDAAVTLRVDFNALLDLVGEPLPPEDTSSAVFPLAAKRFNLDAAVLNRLADIRNQPASTSSAEELSKLLASVIDLTSRAADASARLEAT
jgi:predicted nucleotidyltransferase